jgi:hypothetical protein
MSAAEIHDCNWDARPALMAVPSSDLFGDSSRSYSVICDRRSSRHVVAPGLEWSAARALSDRLDAEYRQRIEADGKRYSSWTADLHECQLESPNAASQLSPESEAAWIAEKVRKAKT